MARIGKLALDAPFFQAGLAGYSDTAMRLVARRHGAPYAVTEALLDILLIAGGRGLRPALLDERDHPVAGQIIGAQPDTMAKAARILVNLGHDVIDVNLACPVKKIRRRARGGHLMSDPERAIAILDAVRQAVPAEIPRTVKLRRGSDDSGQALADFHRIFAAAIDLGYAGAVVHARTVAQKYVGPARWGFLRELVRQYGSYPSPSGKGWAGAARPGEGTPESARRSASASPHPNPLPEGEGAFVIGGSGDIWRAADIFEMIRQTGVGLVSVARGCIGNPWVFTQARALMAGDAEAANRPPTIAQQRAVLLEHFHLAVWGRGEKSAALQMRKFGIKFSRHHPGKQEVARAFIAVRRIADWHNVLDTFYQHDGPGAPVDLGELTPWAREPAVLGQG